MTPRPPAKSTDTMQAYLLGGRPIYFPFVSGVLNYNCETCDAPCCKGSSLGIGRPRELTTLQSVQPDIALFAAPGFGGSAMLSIASPREACWFLDRKSRCRLHKVGGRKAKPAGCRLFPFHRLRSLGDVVCVLPDFSCPLGVGSERNDKAPTSYDELALEMHRTRVPRSGHPALPAPRDLPWEGAVRLERILVDVSADHLGDSSYTQFATRQMEYTAEVMGFAVDAHHMRRVAKNARGFLGVKARPSAEAVRDLVALSGVLRLMASTLPRREMPGLLMVTSVLLGAYEDMRGSSRSARTVVSIFQQRLPLLYALSHLSDRPMLRRDVDPRRLIAGLPSVRAPLLDVLEEVAINRDRDVALTLQEILAQQSDLFVAPLSPEAVTMVFGLGRVLLEAGLFVPV